MSFVPFENNSLYTPLLSPQLRYTRYHFMFQHFGNPKITKYSSQPFPTSLPQLAIYWYRSQGRHKRLKRTISFAKLSVLVQKIFYCLSAQLRFGRILVTVSNQVCPTQLTRQMVSSAFLWIAKQGKPFYYATVLYSFTVTLVLYRVIFYTEVKVMKANLLLYYFLIQVL